MIKRNPAAVVIFSILTCGIYTYYWIYVTTRDIELRLQHSDGTCSNGGLAVLFTILTCGIYSYYWWFQEGKRVAQIEREWGEPYPTDNALVYLILCIFGLSIISTVLMQAELNKAYDMPALPHDPEDTAPSDSNEKGGFNY